MRIDICDVCGTSIGVTRNAYITERAYGMSETVSEIFDLCATHEAQVLKQAIATLFTLDEDVRNRYRFNQILVGETKNLIQDNATLRKEREVHNENY